MIGIDDTPEAVAVARVVDKTAIDRVFASIAAQPRVEAPVVHRFTPGLYTREILMKAGTKHLSKVHKTEHQFIVSSGACFVSENGNTPYMIQAPYHGITVPGTWREIFAVLDCLWTTMHPTDKKTVAEVEADIILSMDEVPK